jgi:metal-responsive CopG/Arc/MetJ family transcriptional regulator
MPRLSVERVRPVSVSMDEELDKVLTRRAIRENTPRSALVCRLLRLALAAEKESGKKDA